MGFWLDPAKPCRCDRLLFCNLGILCENLFWTQLETSTLTDLPWSTSEEQTNPRISSRQLLTSLLSENGATTWTLCDCDRWLNERSEVFHPYYFLIYWKTLLIRFAGNDSRTNLVISCLIYGDVTLKFLFIPRSCTFISKRARNLQLFSRILVLL